MQSLALESFSSLLLILTADALSGPNPALIDILWPQSSYATLQECIFNAFKEVVYVVKGLNQGGFAWLNVTVHAGVIGANRTQLLVAKTHMHVQQNVDSCSIVVFMKLN